MDARIEEMKKTLKARIVNGTADGINGVGIDPVEERLIVFYTDREAALATLQSVEADFLDFVELHRGTPAPPPMEAIRHGFFTFFGNLLAAVRKKFSLEPASVIKPQDGDPGCVGCFVYHEDSTKAVLTVEHIFYLREEHVVRVLSPPNDFKPAGKSWRFGGFNTGQGQSNSADCALFLPCEDEVDPCEGRVDLKRDGRISGKYITKQNAPQTVKRKVTNLASDKNGKVLDVTAMISYEITMSGMNPTKVVFDNQILVRGQNFGQWGDSGSLTVMEKKEADRGDASDSTHTPPLRQNFILSRRFMPVLIFSR